jgi:hypothetical protein
MSNFYDLNRRKAAANNTHPGGKVRFLNKGLRLFQHDIVKSSFAAKGPTLL